MSKDDRANTIVKGWTRPWFKSDLKWANSVNSVGSPQVQQDKRIVTPKSFYYILTK